MFGAVHIHFLCGILWQKPPWFKWYIQIKHVISSWLPSGSSIYVELPKGRRTIPTLVTQIFPLSRRKHAAVRVPWRSRSWWQREPRCRSASSTGLPGQRIMLVSRRQPLYTHGEIGGIGPKSRKRLKSFGAWILVAEWITCGLYGTTKMSRYGL